MVVTACTPTVSGPALPRPTPLAAPATSTTTSGAAATTDTGTEEGEQVPCPTVFCLVYHIDRAATWSDGQAVRVADFAHTAEVMAEQPGADAVGYRMIERIDALDAKTARVAFAAPFGPWQTLFARLFKDGQAADDIARMDTTGPFAFVDWQEGESITLQRKPQWWADSDPISGGDLGDVEEIQFVFIETLEEMVAALEADEVDVIAARPDAATAESLRSMSDITLDLAPGPFWEHIDFHHDDPILSKRWAREAVSLAIDREAILDETVRLVDEEAGTLDNTIWMGDTEWYEAHYRPRHDPDAAESVLADHGCARGSDGIQVCGGQRLSFTWATTNDDSDRRTIFDLVRDDLAEVGIEVVPVFRSPSAFVTRDFLFGGPDVWQMVNFSWRARSDPYPSNPSYYCNDAGDLNVNRFCSPAVEDLVRATNTMVDPEERAATYNEADQVYLSQLASIPLYQEPTLMAWDIVLRGPSPNYTFSGDLWNAAAWSGKDRIVVALPSEPAVLNPLSTADDSANVVIGALLYGAYGMSPSHEFRPVLVESVDVIESTG